MHSKLPHLTAAAALAAVALPAGAASLTFDSPDDLSMLSVGETFTVNVLLSDLDAGQELAALDATTFGPDDLLVAPDMVTPGSIVPSPADTFLGNADSDGQFVFADGFFFALFDGITDEGTFFSFDLTPEAVGSGVIDFDLVNAEDFDGNIVDVTVGDGLSFTVVPEPTSAAVLALLAPALLARRRA